VNDGTVYRACWDDLVPFRSLHVCACRIIDLVLLQNVRAQLSDLASGFNSITCSLGAKATRSSATNSA
jgi:hypothetical protein